MDGDFQRIFGKNTNLVDNFNEFADLMIEIIFPKVSDKFKDEEDRKLWNYIQETNCIDYRKLNVLKKNYIFY